MLGPVSFPQYGHTKASLFEKGARCMERKTSPQSGPMEKARELSKFTSPKTDPQGSWTGRPLDPNEVPVQDADDL